MVLWIVFTILGLIKGWKETSNEDIRFKRVIGSLFGGFLGLLIALCVSSVLLVILPHTYNYVAFERTELVVFKDRSEIQGSFLLAEGSINSTFHYVFYYKTPDGGRKFGKVLAENSIVYEEDRKDAYMVKKKQEKNYQKKYIKKWGWLIPFWLFEGIIEDITNPNRYFYDIHVPRGTIAEGEGLKIDLQ